jgi:hypothetical protein
MTAPPEPPYYRLKRHQIDEFAVDCRANAPWLEPIAEALRCGCGHMIVTQHAGPFRLPRKGRPKPTIATIGDDFLERWARPLFICRASAACYARLLAWRSSAARRNRWSIAPSPPRPRYSANTS